MANRHYEINEEFEVTLKLKIKLKQASDYDYLNDEEIKEEVDYFKRCIENHLTEKIQGEYYREEVTISMDDFTFEVLPVL